MHARRPDSDLAHRTASMISIITPAVSSLALASPALWTAGRSQLGALGCPHRGGSLARMTAVNMGGRLRRRIEVDPH